MSNFIAKLFLVISDLVLVVNYHLAFLFLGGLFQFDALYQAIELTGYTVKRKWLATQVPLLEIASLQEIYSDVIIINNADRLSLTQQRKLHTTYRMHYTEFKKYCFAQSISFKAV